MAARAVCRNTFTLSIVAPPRSRSGSARLIRHSSHDSGVVSTTTISASTTFTSEQKSKDTQGGTEMTKKPKKTIAQLDEELRLKMEGAAGDGGASGVELEDGKPVSMKRGVRENMFRYI